MATDRAVVKALAQLISNLKKVRIPESYRAGHKAMLAALAIEVRELNRRVTTPSDAEGTDRSAQIMRGLHQAGLQLIHAYDLYPANSRPLPAMFGPDRHFS